MLCCICKAVMRIGQEGLLHLGLHGHSSMKMIPYPSSPLPPICHPPLPSRPASRPPPRPSRRSSPRCRPSGPQGSTAAQRPPSQGSSPATACAQGRMKHPGCFSPHSSQASTNIRYPLRCRAWFRRVLRCTRGGSVQLPGRMVLLHSPR